MDEPYTLKNTIGCFYVKACAKAFRRTIALHPTNEASLPIYIREEPVRKFMPYPTAFVNRVFIHAADSNIVQL
jgi:hypothetical protein